MSQLIDGINSDLIEAMKAHEEVRVSTLRMLTAAFKNKQIEFGHELTDAEALEVIAKNAKQHRESIEAYEKGDRADLATKEKSELEILAGYLPEMMGSEEIAKIVDEILAGSSERDMGKVMGLVMAQVKGRADGGEVSKVVREKLAS